MSLTRWVALFSVAFSLTFFSDSSSLGLLLCASPCGTAAVAGVPTVLLPPLRRALAVCDHSCRIE
eukprot:m.477190 g.477190  ORF g.477190 m.477190 type:complete len:65 (-) comp43124_c0_seq1:61-255(-)